MTHKLSDLNNHLFAQLDRLAKDGMSAEEIETEVKRADAIVALADQVTKGADTQLKAAKLFAEHGAQVLPHLPLIGSSRE